MKFSTNRGAAHWTKTVFKPLATVLFVLCCVPKVLASQDLKRLPTLERSLRVSNDGQMEADGYQLVPRLTVDADGIGARPGPREHYEPQAADKREKVGNRNRPNDGWNFAWHLTKTALIVGAFITPAAIWNDKDWVRYYAMGTATVGGAWLGSSALLSLVNNPSLDEIFTIGVLGLVLGGIGGWLLSDWSTANDGIGRPITVGFSFSPFLISRIATYE